MNVSNLKIARLKAGLTQWQLAQRLGIKERLISLYEQGRANPSIEMAVNIAKILNCDPGEIWPETFSSKIR